jgi:hypothetical protein
LEHEAWSLRVGLGEKQILLQIENNTLKKYDFVICFFIAEVSHFFITNYTFWRGFGKGFRFEPGAFGFYICFFFLFLNFLKKK